RRVGAVLRMGPVDPMLDPARRGDQVVVGGIRVVDGGRGVGGRGAAGGRWWTGRGRAARGRWCSWARRRPARNLHPLRSPRRQTGDLLPQVPREHAFGGARSALLLVVLARPPRPALDRDSGALSFLRLLGPLLPRADDRLEDREEDDDTEEDQLAHRAYSLVVSLEPVSSGPAIECRIAVSACMLRYRTKSMTPR